MNQVLLLLALLSLCGSEVEIATYFPSYYKLFYWPQPTAEMLTMVGECGHDSFFIRERATRRLEELHWDAIGAAYRGSLHKDPEIARRCRYVVQKNLDSITVENTPAIFTIHNDTKFKIKDREITIPMHVREFYYKRTWDYMFSCQPEWQQPRYQDYQWTTGELATRNLADTLIILGSQPKDIESTFEGVRRNSFEWPEHFLESYDYGP